MSQDAGGPACPIPKRSYQNIVLGHGGGGELSRQLVEQIFLPAFGTEQIDALPDAALVELPSTRIAVSTDTYVVRPLFFPGGSIGELAINGTVNDLAMRGATPKLITTGFVIEEGFAMDDLRRIADAMGQAAHRAKVSIVAGDTKVVERGACDGCFINTAGIGVVAEHAQIGPDRARDGDHVLISGTIGDHAMAIMSLREGLGFESTIRSDTAPLAELVEEMIGAGADVHVLRDPTRGGLAATLNEIAVASGVGIEIQQDVLPVDPVVGSACEILGLDPLNLANEGKLVCIVPAQDSQAVLDVMRHNALGRNTRQIGLVTKSHPGIVSIRSPLGSNRILPMPLGEQLPRIC